MAVQQCLSSHALLNPHDLGGHAFGSGGGLLLDALGVGGIGDAVFGCGGEAQQQPPRSELTCNGNDVGGFVPRKRARVAAAPGLLLDCGSAQGLGALPLPVHHGQAFDVPSRALGCGAPSTSGRLSQGVVSQGLYYNQDAEVDALVRLETERMRLSIQDARQRHLRAVVAAVERAAVGRLRAAEAELERARLRNAELEERLRQVAAEGQAWLGVARSHEAVATGLRATLDQLLLQQQQQLPVNGCGGGASSDDAEDAQSCCFDNGSVGVADDAASASRGAAWCRSCRGAEASVLLLPCRHLCVCRACEPRVDACPVCAAAKNASLQVLLS